VPYYDDLLKSASKLLGSQRGRPQFSNCNRAVSTAYYALFDCVCRTYATRICGRVAAGVRPTEEWISIYRSLDHTSTKHKLFELKDADPLFLQLAVTFSKLQEARHSADYDPARQFSKAEAQVLIAEAEVATEMAAALAPELITKLVVKLLSPKQNR
jgi:uncharacterized protein (UPF0332 family)